MAKKTFSLSPQSWLKALAQLPWMDRLHWAAGAAFKKAGYRLELRRTGDLQLALWRMHFRKAGAAGFGARRLVLLPGFGDTPLSWLGVLLLLQPVLRRQFDEVVLFDFPGFHGYLSREKCFSSMDLLIAQVGDTLDSLRPNTVIGHSLGGWLAGRYGVDCGEGSRPKAKSRGRHGYSGPDSLILFNPSGIFGTPAERHRWEATFRRAMAEGFEPLRASIFEKEPKWFSWIADQFGKFIQREDTIQFMLSISEKHALEGKLHHMKARTWLVWGEKDALVPAKWVKDWLKEMVGAPQGAHGILLKGVGHSPQLEKPAVTAAVLSRILGGKDFAKESTGALGKLEELSRKWWTLVPAEEKA